MDDFSFRGLEESLESGLLFVVASEAWVRKCRVELYCRRFGTPNQELGLDTSFPIPTANR